jgi:hypothetical protein
MPIECLVGIFSGIRQTEQIISLIRKFVPGFTQLRTLIVALAVVGASLPMARASGASSPVRESTMAGPNIVIGFVGGFVGHDNLRHGPVQLAQRIKRTAPKDTTVLVFENRHRRRAFGAVVHLLDTNHDGTLSPEEKARARIIIFGHSWGASSVVLLARDLRRAGVPVLLTVQVDSVAKLWQNDSVIPDNVAQAVNFYQPNGIIHGRARIVAADPLKTQILGNFRTNYRKDPVSCMEASWADRLFTAGHMQAECDPHVWSQIENMVKQRLTAAASVSAAVHAQP